MATRGGSGRRVPENDSTIAFVQADGLVSAFKTFNLKGNIIFVL